MIRLTIRCDKCGDAEQTAFRVRTENDVYRKIKDSGFQRVKKPDGTTVLLGPVCFKAYSDINTQADITCKKTKEEFFEGS